VYVTATRNRLLQGTLALAVAIGVALVIGVPTGIVETPWYTRMTPVLWWNYPVWLISSLLTGVLVATYIKTPVRAPAGQGGKTLGASLLSVFAVGCPICNKLVVLALGVNGALTWFAPAQPLLAVASLGLLGYALRARLQTPRQCVVEPARPLSPTE
jgi:hypothetical protein